MRDLMINQRKIHYQCYSDEETFDKYGNPRKKYGEIKELNLCVSSNKGESTEDIFGRDLDYDRTMTTHDMSCEIDEFTRLWIDNSVDKPFDYTVKSVSKSYSSIKYAIKKVNVYENKD